MVYCIAGVPLGVIISKKYESLFSFPFPKLAEGNLPPVGRGPHFCEDWWEPIVRRNLGLKMFGGSWVREGVRRSCARVSVGVMMGRGTYRKWLEITALSASWKFDYFSGFSCDKERDWGPVFQNLLKESSFGRKYFILAWIWLWIPSPYPCFSGTGRDLMVEEREKRTRGRGRGRIERGQKEERDKRWGTRNWLVGQVGWLSRGNSRLARSWSRPTVIKLLLREFKFALLFYVNDSLAFLSLFWAIACRHSPLLLLSCPPFLFLSFVSRWFLYTFFFFLSVEDFPHSLISVLFFSLSLPFFQVCIHSPLSLTHFYLPSCLSPSISCLQCHLERSMTPFICTLYLFHILLPPWILSFSQFLLLVYWLESPLLLSCF